MAERFTADLLFIVIVLLVAALLGFLIGYLLRKSMKCKKCAEWEEANSTLKIQIKKLEDDKTSIKEQLLKQEGELRGKDLRIRELESEAAKNKPVAPKKPEKSPAKDNLQVVNGIGPKISQILKNRGITTWKQLSETSPDVISQHLIQDGGERYRMHDPVTWPHQAKLADEGKWEDLKTFQAELRE